VKQPNLPIKAAAVASSLLLVGGLVAHRGGAFNGLMRPSPLPGDSSSNPAVEKNPSDGCKADTFLGWRYSWTRPDPDTTEGVTLTDEPQPRTTQSEGTYISATKAAIYVIKPPSPDPPAARPPATNPKKESSP
jgi:hypothetical protein